MLVAIGCWRGLIELAQRSERRGAGCDRSGPDLLQQTSDPIETIALLDRVVSPATMAMAGPRFFGFVIGGSLPVTVAANWLAAAWDQNPALYEVTPGVSRLEEVASRWLTALFDLAASSGAGFVSGATVANFTALAAARHAVLACVGWNVEADGLSGSAPITAQITRHARVGTRRLIMALCAIAASMALYAI